MHQKVVWSQTYGHVRSAYESYLDRAIKYQKATREEHELASFPHQQLTYTHHMICLKARMVAGLVRASCGGQWILFHFDFGIA